MCIDILNSPLFHSDIQVVDQWLLPTRVSHDQTYNPAAETLKYIYYKFTIFNIIIKKTFWD